MYAASEGLSTLLLEREAVERAGTTSVIRTTSLSRGIGSRRAHVPCSRTGAGNGRGNGVRPVRRWAQGGVGTQLLTLGRRQPGPQSHCGDLHRRDLSPAQSSGLDELLGAGVFYGAAVAEAAALKTNRFSSSAERTRLDRPRYTCSRFASHQPDLLMQGPPAFPRVCPLAIHEIEQAINISIDQRDLDRRTRPRPPRKPFRCETQHRPRTGRVTGRAVRADRRRPRSLAGRYRGARPEGLPPYRSDLNRAGRWTDRPCKRAGARACSLQAFHAMARWSSATSTVGEGATQADPSPYFASS